jgi:hypothetical protein
LIFDTSDKSWSTYFTKEEIKEIAAYKPKKLDEFPNTLNSYMEDLGKLNDTETLWKKLADETGCSACEWARYTVLEYIKLFKYQYLSLLDQSEGDMLYCIYKSAPGILRDVVLPGFVVFGKRNTILV